MREPLSSLVDLLVWYFPLAAVLGTLLVVLALGIWLVSRAAQKAAADEPAWVQTNTRRTLNGVQDHITTRRRSSFCPCDAGSFSFLLCLYMIFLFCSFLLVLGVPGLLFYYFIALFF